MVEKVLVVDNRPEHIGFIRKAFLKFGQKIAVQAVEDSKEAQNYFSLLKRSPRILWPKLIFLNLDFPGFEGFDLLEYLKHDETLRFIPLIVYSHTDYATDVNYCYLLNTNAYVKISEAEQDFDRIIGNCCRYWLKFVQVAY